MKQTEVSPNRAVWIFGLLAFLLLAPFLVMSSDCLCAMGRIKVRALSVTFVAIAVRMLVGLIRNERKRTLLLYIALTVVVFLIMKGFG